MVGRYQEGGADKQIELGRRKLDRNLVPFSYRKQLCWNHFSNYFHFPFPNCFYQIYSNSPRPRRISNWMHNQISIGSCNRDVLPFTFREKLPHYKYVQIQIQGKDKFRMVIWSRNWCRKRNAVAKSVFLLVGEDFELSDIAQNLHRCGFKTGGPSGERRRGWRRSRGRRTTTRAGGSRRSSTTPSRRTGSWRSRRRWEWIRTIKMKH